MTDAEGTVTAYTFDVLSRPFQTPNLAIQATPLEQHTYTSNRKPLSVTNTRGNMTTYVYYGLDRLARTTFAMEPVKV